MERMDRKLILETVDMVARTAATNGLVHKPDEFLQLFTFKVTNGQGANGGIHRDKIGERKWGKPYPIVRLGVQSHHTSRERGMALNLKKHTGKVDKVWQQASLFAKGGDWLMVEYTHIHCHPVIGGFVSDNAYYHGLAAICHEVAHAAQFWNHEVQCDAKCERVKAPVAHGEEFKHIYRNLRRTFGLLRLKGTWLLDEQRAEAA